MLRLFFMPLGRLSLMRRLDKHVFAQAHGGDVGELVVFVDEGCVGVGSRHNGCA